MHVVSKGEREAVHVMSKGARDVKSSSVHVCNERNERKRCMWWSCACM